MKPAASGSPGRREIGHGKLAWRAVEGRPAEGDDFPYTLRIVSEIMESNGSSSMATVCGASLAMMDAGVPITRPVSGIAMGLIKDAEGIAILSDILGDEDHLGDMDFKVAGTEVGVTSLQMDLKIDSVTFDIMKTALAQANGGRLHILERDEQGDGRCTHRVSENAPKMISMKIPVDKIRDVIGTGGKVIREIVEKTGAKINVEDDGTVKIAAVEKESLEAAQKWIHGLTAEAGSRRDLRRQGREGHGVRRVRELLRRERRPRARLPDSPPSALSRPSAVVKEGDTVKVKLLGFDDRGKVRLSMKAVNQQTGEAIEGVTDDGRRPADRARGEGGDRPRGDRR